jgi:hypothetical protein
LAESENTIMATEIKSLTTGDAPQPDNALVAQNESFNIIPTANVVYDLYAAPDEPEDNNRKGAIVSSLRLINIHATATAKVTLYFNRPTTSGQSRRRLLTPADMQLPPNYMYIDEAEITLEPGDKIQGKSDTAGVVQYLISGMERDVI